jgi:hypothetical protein
MSPAEQEIIDILNEIKSVNLVEHGKAEIFCAIEPEIAQHLLIQPLLKKLKTASEPAALSLEFLRHPTLVEYLTHPQREELSAMSERDINPSIGEYLIVWRLLRDTVDAAGTSELPELLARFEIELLKRQNEQLNDILSLGIFKCVYASSCPELIALFERHYPTLIPREEYFDPSAIPPRVRASTDAAIEGICRLFAEGSISNFNQLEAAVLVMQRKHRQSLMHKEHEMRGIALDRHPTPYRPRCNEELAERVVRLSRDVKLFSSLRHLTNRKGLCSIMNDGFWGRQNLVRHLMPFSPFALQSSDIQRGDANAICFGPQHIDSRFITEGTVEIVLHSDPLLKNRHLPLFLKQMDFGFRTQREDFPNIPLFPDAEDDMIALSFMHTEYPSLCFGDKTIEFGLYWGDVRIAFSQFNFDQFIVENHGNAHQILCLNFFKLLDALQSCTVYVEPAAVAAAVERIYVELSKLDDVKLQAFLERIGKALTRTSEVNIHGAYRIDDFSMIESISSEPDQTVSRLSPPFLYRLSMSAFINELNEGNLSMLREARERLPELLKSYRFLDFLLSKVSQEDSVGALQVLRGDCFEPRWRRTMRERHGSDFFAKAPESLADAAPHGSESSRLSCRDKTV